ncbi:MAG: hypothetical protein IT324_05085 [Anaerolineae bacterium]|nr:hypothetical protein [Anaerolineae bacterium]
MTDYLITLHVPDYVYERARKIAEETAQPIEQVLAARLEYAFDDRTDLSFLPPDEQSELAAFKQLSNDTLPSIAREQLPRTVQERVQYLGNRNSQGTITLDEHTKYARLVEQGERLTYYYDA